MNIDARSAGPPWLLLAPKCICILATSNNEYSKPKQNKEGRRFSFLLLFSAFPLFSFAFPFLFLFFSFSFLLFFLFFSLVSNPKKSREKQRKTEKSKRKRQTKTRKGTQTAGGFQLECRDPPFRTSRPTSAAGLVWLGCGFGTAVRPLLGSSDLSSEKGGYERLRVKMGRGNEKSTWVYKEARTRFLFGAEQQYT